MAESEYGDRFELFLTPDMGMKHVTNATSIEIVGLVRRGECTVTDVAERLRIPKSSAQASLAKLVRMGILGSAQSETDGRKVVYYIRAYTFLRSSGRMEPWMAESRRAAMRNILSGRDTYNSAIVQFTVTAMELGVDTSPFLFEIGNAMAYYMKDGLKDLDDDSLLARLREIFDVADDVEMRVSAGNAFTMEMSSDRNIAFEAFMLMNTMSGLLFAVYPLRTGVFYSGQSELEVSRDGCSARLRACRVDGAIRERHLMPLADRSPGYYRMDDPMMILRVGERTILFGNGTMVSIISELRSGDSTIPIIASKLGLPPVTVSSSMGRLASLGAVEQVGREGRTITYRLAGTVIVDRSASVDTVYPDLYRAIDHLRTRELSNTETLYAIFALSCTMAGMEYGAILSAVGRTMGEFILEENPGISAEGFVRAACGAMVRKSARAEVDSMIPLSVTVHIPGDEMNPVYRGHTVIYLSSVLKTGIAAITGMDYPVSVQVVDE